MKFQIIKKPTQIKELNKILHPGEVYLINSPDIVSNSLYTIDKHLFQNYFHSIDKDIKNVFIGCYGGIGDIMMHSSICDFLQDKNINFITSIKYQDIFDWFEKPVTILDHRNAIISDYTLHNKITKYKNYRYINTIERYFKDNNHDWYELLFRLIGIDKISPDFLRPHLRTERISDKPSNIKHDNALLIHNRSTAMMRNIDFFTIYNALSDKMKNKYEIYVHIDNLSPDDLKQPLNGINIIKADSMGDFLLDLYDAKEVITVDSNPTHFREGIKKHAICLFNSFPKDIRTKYYKYVDCFDIHSECDLQPCCLHKSNLKQYCDKGTKDMFSAPCFKEEYNKYLKGQLIDIFNTYL